MGKLAKRLTEVIGFAPELLRAILIALDLPRLRVIGSLIQIAQITFLAANGSAEVANP
jgi:hypothetical protein